MNPAPIQLTKRFCPGCRTNERSKTSVLCATCWRAAPERLKKLFRKPSCRREALRGMIDHFRRERQEPRLF
jgi:hypothetical protein